MGLGLNDLHVRCGMRISMLASWSIDILRQSKWDLWCWISIFVAILLAISGLLSWKTGMPFKKRAFLLYIAPLLMTGLILSLPQLRKPAVGLIWLIFLLSLVSTLNYLESRKRLSRRQLGGLLGLRLLAILLAVPMLFEPVIRVVSTKNPDRSLLVLIDASGSMSVPDTPNGQTRFQLATQSIESEWDRMHLAYASSLVPFGIKTDRSIKSPDELRRLIPDAPSTDLVNAIGAVIGKNKQGSAEIILISDGIDNASADVASAIESFKVPVHTVLVGTDQSQPTSLVNVAIEEINPGDEWTVRSPATINCIVHSSSLAGRVVQVYLSPVDEAGRPVATPITQQLVLDSKSNGQLVKFEYTPEKTGIHRMAVWVEPVAGERSSADNKRVFQQLVTDARIRVLFIAGSTRLEDKPLRNFLRADANIELASLTLLRNNQMNSEGTLSGKSLTAIPTRADDWRQADVIILSDVTSSMLNPQRMAEIEKAVSDGSSLLMIGGKSSLGPGGFAGTPIEKILPVNVGGIDNRQNFTEFIPQISTIGENHPSMQSLGKWFNGQPFSSLLPTLLGNVIVDQPKPGADVLLTRKTETGESQIVLAVQRYGKGRSAVFTADTTYRWNLPMRGMGQESPYNIFWGQLVRWLGGTDVKNRGTQPGVETIVDQSNFTIGEKVRVRALVRDQRGDATRYADVKINLSRDGASDSERISQPFTTVDGRDGMYQLLLTNLSKGNWTGEVVASKDGAELGKQPIQFSVIPPADEMFKLAANSSLMKEIAEKTGGFAYSIPQFSQLIDALNRKHASDAPQQHTVPMHNLTRLIPATIGIYPNWPAVYDLPVQTMLVIILLAAEWVLRRKYELP